MKRQILNYTVIIKPDKRTGTNEPCYSAYCPTLSAYSDGDTVEEALKNVKEAIELTLEVMAEGKEPIPVEPENTMVINTSVPAPAHFVATL